MKHYRFLLPMSSFAGRAAVFFFCMSALLVFVYVLGNYQDFLDSTQEFLLLLLRVSLSLQLVAGMWCAGLLVYRSVRERRPRIVRWILLLLSMAVCAVVLAALRFVQQWLVP
jgi:uncharacterized membrane protein YfcA